jgi:predicted metal-dependent phosphoesterase TrpH
MALRFDTHLHTQRHSRCIQIDEHQLIETAVQRGLDGLVITEHHYQWSVAELAELAAEAGHEGFVLLAGFEYSSSKGDILMYGLSPEDVVSFPPGGDPEAMLALAQEMGAVCVAAHPTRASIPFDERILQMPFDGIEIQSVNLAAHEQRLAKKLAENLGIPGTSSSDSHRLEDIGAYSMEFDVPIRGMSDLLNAVKCGKFRTVA